MLRPKYPQSAPPTSIRSERVLTPDGLKPATLHLEDGCISRIDESEDVAGVLDLGDTLLMAAIIDSHVHINEPGRTEWEGFETATRAAVKGGVSVVADMPLNSMPVTTSRRALDEKSMRHVESSGRIVPCGVGWYPTILTNSKGWSALGWLDSRHSYVTRVSMIFLL